MLYSGVSGQISTVELYPTMGRPPKVVPEIPQNANLGYVPEAPRVAVPVALVPSKPAWKSLTMLVNSGLFALASFIQVYDLLTGANVLRPIVEVFVKDPDGVTRVLTVITQAYSVVNLWLRMRTTQPVSLTLK